MVCLHVATNITGQDWKYSDFLFHFYKSKMSNNCYRPSKDEVGEQNERLTNKHIQTLGFLQELSRENKELRLRVDELEVSLKMKNY